MLQHAERSRKLFRTAVKLPLPPATQSLPERPVPEQPTIEERIKKEAEKLKPAVDNQQVAFPIPFWTDNLFGWLASFRTGIRRLRSGSNGHAHSGNGLADVKALALQQEIKLVERLFFGPDSNSNRVIMFSGVDKGKGGARVCARAAQTLATQVQGSVCLVDADLHSRSLQHYLQVKDSPGLSEALLQCAPIRCYAQQLAITNLWMITSGAAGVNSQIPLSFEHARVRFEELLTQFDYVLINAPRKGNTSSLTLLGRLVDGVIFVVEANSTRRRTTKEFKKSLEESDVRVLGVVLTS